MDEGLQTDGKYEKSSGFSKGQPENVGRAVTEKVSFKFSVNHGGAPRTWFRSKVSVITVTNSRVFV